MKSLTNVCLSLQQNHPGFDQRIGSYLSHFMNFPLCVPTYNHEQYRPDAEGALMQQTSFDFEGDEMTLPIDATQEIIRKYDVWSSLGGLVPGLFCIQRTRARSSREFAGRNNVPAKAPRRICSYARRRRLLD